MGYIRHQAAIAMLSDTDHDEPAIAAIEALREEMRDDDAIGVPDCILGPCKGINGTITYFFAPDGSKEGWASSTACDDYRKRFIEAAKKSPWPSTFELLLGGDNREMSITSGEALDLV